MWGTCVIFKTYVRTVHVYVILPYVTYVKRTLYKIAHIVVSKFRTVLVSLTDERRQRYTGKLSALYY